MNQLLKALVDQQASDLHLIVGSVPCLRVDGRIVRIKADKLDPKTIKEMMYSILSDKQKAKFEEKKELDFSFGVKRLARFRCNLSYHMGTVSSVFRRIPNEIPTFESLHLPQILHDLAKAKSGLILVTGATGSGKSTTLAAMIDRINREEHGSIMTIEDPVEYIHTHKNCVVRQREVGLDTKAFHTAMRSLLRQDPDYCLVGEMRDKETIEAALTVAETGHLVFGTLHTNNAVQTINRIMTVFSAEQQERVRIQLSFSLQAIVAQQLIPAINGGLALACEILVPNTGIRNLIRENKLHQISGLMQTGQAYSGMQTMNQSIMQLLVKRKVEMKDAFRASPDPDELDQLLRKAGL
ncbi:MAG: type IV pilus twitching motility protein PilT [Bdellovibrionales bacterium]